MVQSSNVKKVASKSMALFVVKMCFLFILLSLSLLVTGCSTVPPEDKDFFYDTWIHPNGITPIQ